MIDEVVYMSVVVVAGFAVNYALRALPFVLFSRADRELPAWVDRLGKIVSPIIIAGLIVYSYSGLSWRSAWPYLAGVLTVGLQLWRRNPLVSIVAGTIVYMCLLNCGCASERMVRLDAKDPSIRVTEDALYLDDEEVTINDVIERLEDSEIPRDRVIPILLDPEVKNLTPARSLMFYIAKAGWSRPVLVTKRHAESTIGKAKPKSANRSGGANDGSPRVIRYKKAGE